MGKQQAIEAGRAQVVMCAEAIIALRLGEVGGADLDADQACAKWADGGFKLAAKVVALGGAK